MICVTTEDDINHIEHHDDQILSNSEKPFCHMKTIRKKLALIAFGGVPFFASAHPGHGHENPLSPGHYVVNPQHLIPLLLTVAISLIAILIYRAYVIRSKEDK